MDTTDINLEEFPWECEALWIALWETCEKAVDPQRLDDPELEAARIKARALFDQAWKEFSPIFELKGKMSLNLGTFTMPANPDEARTVVETCAQKACDELNREFRGRAAQALDRVVRRFWEYEIELEELRKRIG